MSDRLASPARLSATALAGLVFAGVWLAYQPVLALVVQTWAPTGDEPHYLLAAHSLVHDGDLDLANNYASHDYAAFYPNPYLDPHVRVLASGAQLLSHDAGLPVLLALPYALGGRAGAQQALALVGAALAAQMALLGYEASGRWWAGALSALSLALTAPLGLYAFQIYPEIVGGLVTIWVLRQALGTRQWLTGPAPQPALTTARAALVGVALAALPWLSGRYAPLQLLLVAAAAWRPRDASRARSLWLASAPALLSLAAYLAFNLSVYGSLSPSATPSGDAVASGFAGFDLQQLGRGLMGWWLDQHRGLLIFGPVLALALIGLPHLVRLRGLKGLGLYLPAVVAWLLASAWGGFYSAWEVSARFLIVGLPPLAAGIAAALAGIGGAVGRARRVIFWPLAAGLVTVSACNAAYFVLDPFAMLHQSPVAFWEAATGLRLREVFPAAGTRYIESPFASEGEDEWRGGLGQPGYLHQSRGIAELSVGWYALYAQAQLTSASNPDALALTIDAYSSEAGQPLFHAEFRPREADPATGLVTIRVPFFNPYVDRWDYPFYVDVYTTGAAAVRVSRLLFEPDPAPTYGVAAAWLGVIGLATVALSGGNKKAEA